MERNNDEVNVRVLEAKFEAGFAEITRRLDRQDEVLTQIHRETRATNGQVAKHEAQLQMLEGFRRTDSSPVITSMPQTDRTLQDRMKDWGIGSAFVVSAWKLIEYAIHTIQSHP